MSRFIAHDYSCADLDSLRNHLRDVPWEDIFKYIIYIYIPHRKYQVKPYSSSWFSAACTAAIVHRNTFFPL